MAKFLVVEKLAIEGCEQCHWEISCRLMQLYEFVGLQVHRYEFSNMFAILRSQSFKVPKGINMPVTQLDYARLWVYFNSIVSWHERHPTFNTDNCNWNRQYEHIAHLTHCTCRLPINYSHYFLTLVLSLSMVKILF